MITPNTKANAISLLKLGESPRKVSEDLELPFMLVQEWYEQLDPNDLIALNANTNALAKLVNCEVLENTDNIAVLKLKIEETAVAIVEKANDLVLFPDLASAKALESLANTCSKLYATIISKQTLGQVDSGNFTLLEQLGLD